MSETFHIYLRGSGSDFWFATCGRTGWRVPGGLGLGEFAKALARRQLGLPPGHPVAFHIL